MPRDDTGGGSGGGLALFVPPLGDPFAIRSFASTLSSGADSVGDAAVSVRRQAERVVSSTSWTGTAADGFTSSTDLLKAGLSAQEGPTHDVAAACQGFADALDQAQRRIAAAATRYDSAQSASDALVAQVNANPDRTPAEVAAAQQTIDGYSSQMQAAVDDATLAWNGYREAEQSHSAKITGAVIPLQTIPSLEELLRLLGDVNEYTDAFGSIWELAWSYASVRNLAAVIGGGSEPIQTLESLLTAVRAGAAESPAAVAAAASEVSALQGEIAALQALKARGLLSGAEATRLGQLQARLPSALSRLESAVGGAESFSKWSKILGGASKVLTGIAVLGDVMTLIDPPHEGGWGVVDRVAAGGNLVGLGIGAVAATSWGGALLAGTAIPVVGQVLVVGTGLYLAGSWLYDNWEPFHDVVDSAVGGIVDAAHATGEFLSDAGETIGEGLEAAGDAIGDALGSLFGG